MPESDLPTLVATGILVFGGCLAGLGLFSREPGQAVPVELWIGAAVVVGLLALFVFLAIVTWRWASRGDRKRRS